jgi:TonB-dependent starch-binding outer membrane protein SusC
MTMNRLLKKIASIAICVLLTQFAFSQNKVITGKVTDDKGNPVQGATVTVKGSQAGAATNASGNFTLNAPASAKTLVVSSVGYALQEIDITDKTSVSISLVSSSTSLNDVVVVGYGTARRKDVTGAVSSVASKDFNQGVVTDPLQAVQGKVAGVLITQPGGDPNGGLIIRLRGQASLVGGQTPLIVLDGVPLDDPTQLSNIPPADIASFDFLKDASAAAIYGSRGANGVIIVNTKKGVGGQTKVEYNGFVGVDKLAKNYPLLNAAQWKSASESIGIPDSVIATYNHGGNVDWFKAITQTAYTQSHNVAMSGGTGHFNYRASVNYINQDGIILNSNKEGIGIRFNAQQKAFDDKLDIQAGIVYTQYNRKYTDYSVFNKVFSIPPTYPVRNPDGSFFTFSDFEQYNPVEHLDLIYNRGKEFLTQLYGSATYALFPSLKVGVMGSISHFNKHTNWFYPSFPSEGNDNNANETNYNTDSKKGNVNINYSKQFGQHSFGATAVYEYNYFTDDNFNANGTQFLVPELQYNYLQGGNTSKNILNSFAEEYYLISFLGRVNYNYAGKYYATASIRRDGSSKFGGNQRYGNFPSFDLAWRISQEDFMKGVSWLTDLKLRGGYGVTGNSDAITPYSTQFLLSGQLPNGTVTRYFSPSSPNQYPQAYQPSQNANADLRWEEVHGSNIGLDFSLFNGRVSGGLDVYSNKTVNLLNNYTVPTPPEFYQTILANVGTLTNKGWEISLNAQIVRGRHFTWTASGQFTAYQTKITSLAGSFQGFKVNGDNIPEGYAEGRGLSTNPISFLKVGYSPYIFLLPHYVGVDQNGNQLFDSAGAKVPYGHAHLNYIDPAPKFNYGFSSTFTYDQWSLNFALRGVGGQKIFNNTALDVAYIKRLPGNNVFTSALTNGIRDAATASDLYMENASFLRLDNLTLAYTFKKIGNMQNLRLYISANNLFVITKYSGLDPEIRNANTTQSYIDANYGGDGYYARSRSFSFGVNVAFQ